MTLEQKALTVGSYTGSFVSIVAGFNVADWGVVCGMMLGIATYVTNVYFKRQHLKLAREKFASEQITE